MRLAGAHRVQPRPPIRHVMMFQRPRPPLRAIPVGVEALIEGADAGFVALDPVGTRANGFQRAAERVAGHRAGADHHPRLARQQIGHLPIGAFQLQPDGVAALHLDRGDLAHGLDRRRAGAGAQTDGAFEIARHRRGVEFDTVVERHPRPQRHREFRQIGVVAPGQREARDRLTGIGQFDQRVIGGHQRGLRDGAVALGLQRIERRVRRRVEVDKGRIGVRRRFGGLNRHRP